MLYLQNGKRPFEMVANGVRKPGNRVRITLNQSDIKEALLPQDAYVPRKPWLVWVYDSQAWKGCATSDKIWVELGQGLLFRYADVDDVVDLDLFKNLGIPDVAVRPPASSSPNSTQPSFSMRRIRQFEEVFPYASSPPSTPVASSSQDRRPSHDEAPVAGPSGTKRHGSPLAAFAKKKCKAVGDNYHDPIVVSSDDEYDVIDLTLSDSDA